jgi:transcriptional regulator with XRE-family HTH domain
MKEPIQLTEVKRVEAILTLLKGRQMSQQDLATSIGRPIQTVQRWIHGKSIPELTPIEFIELRSALDCSYEDLAVFFPGHSRRNAAIKASHQNR